MKWTKAYRRARGKDMAMDSTFTFEKKRHAPVRYNRELMVKTIRGMQIVDRIKQVRKERFQKSKLAQNLKIRQSAAQAEIAKGADILQGPNKDKALHLRTEIA